MFSDIICSNMSKFISVKLTGNSLAKAHLVFRCEEHAKMPEIGFTT